MKMVHVLYGSIALAAVVAGVRSFAGTPPPSSDPAPVVAEPQGPSVADMAPGDSEEQAPQNAPAAGIGGEVLEKIDVPSYSYLRVGQKGTEGTWVAVPTAPVQVGDSVRVAGAMKMSNFQSKGLNRTFDTIYFGNLDSGGSRAAAAPQMAGDNPHAGMGAGMSGDPSNPHAGMNGGAANPHGGMNGAPAAAPVDVKAVAKAEGANGKTVAEVIGQRTSLSGKSVRIRGTVVKVNGGILGRTYLHLRDGSGDATAATNDILVTTEAVPTLGETILVEGVVAIDRDIGAGYKFSTMVEDAKLVSKP